MRLVRLVRGGQLPPRAAYEDPAQARAKVLARTVEDEVIPRLLQARRPRLAHAVADTATPDAGQVQSLVQLAAYGSQSGTDTFVAGLRDAGTPIESLYLDLITPAARRLGVMWEEDDCSFSDVTLGVLRLGNVMRLLDTAFAGDSARQGAAPSILLAQMPGEQHGLGLAMVSQFFRRAGWQVRQESMPASAALEAIVAADWYGVVGISLACDTHLDALPGLILALRRASRNKAVGMLVGGPPFLAQPELAAMVGADGTAMDGLQAVRCARGLVA